MFAMSKLCLMISNPFDIIKLTGGRVYLLYLLPVCGSIVGNGSLLATIRVHSFTDYGQDISPTSEGGCVILGRGIDNCGHGMEYSWLMERLNFALW